MRSGHTLAVLASLSSLAVCAAAQAATISYLGEDDATGPNWRTASTAKPATFNPSGNNVYGSDGYNVLTYNGEDPGWYGGWAAPNGRAQHPVVLPAYVQSISTPAGFTSWGGSNLGLTNDPTAAIQPTTIGMGAWNSYAYWPGETDINGNQAPTLFQITLSAPADFIMGVIHGGGNLALDNLAGLQVKQTVGGSADTGLMAANGFVASSFATSQRYSFFEISGQAGDEFTVYGNAGRQMPNDSNFIGVGGLTFDAAAVPEPTSLALLGLCPLMLMSRKRQR